MQHQLISKPAEKERGAMLLLNSLSKETFLCMDLMVTAHAGLEDGG
jgi:hypothetical protein